jgi:hypothetical protein
MILRRGEENCTGSADRHLVYRMKKDEEDVHN